MEEYSTSCSEGKDPSRSPDGVGWHHHDHHQRRCCRRHVTRRITGSRCRPSPRVERTRRRTSRSFYSTSSSPLLRMYYPPLATLVLFASAVFRIAEACSSRSTPKPRPPSQSVRPNITFPTYACPKEYQNYFCLNGARCFTVKIENNVLYNCECTDGFTGPRCEYKDLDGSYLPSREKVMIETASIAGGLTVAVLLIVIITIAIYVCVRKRNKEKRLTVTEETLKQRPFSSRVTGLGTMANLCARDPEAGDECLPREARDRNSCSLSYSYDPGRHPVPGLHHNNNGGP